MNKSVIFGLFLMASLLMGTSLNMNMFSTAMASEKDRDETKDTTMIRTTNIDNQHMNQIHIQLVITWDIVMTQQL